MGRQGSKTQLKAPEKGSSGCGCRSPWRVGGEIRAAVGFSGAARQMSTYHSPPSLQGANAAPGSRVKSISFQRAILVYQRWDPTACGSPSGKSILARKQSVPRASSWQGQAMQIEQVQYSRLRLAAWPAQEIIGLAPCSRASTPTARSRPSHRAPVASCTARPMTISTFSEPND